MSACWDTPVDDETAATIENLGAAAGPRHQVYRWGSAGTRRQPVPRSGHASCDRARTTTASPRRRFGVLLAGTRRWSASPSTCARLRPRRHPATRVDHWARVASAYWGAARDDDGPGTSDRGSILADVPDRAPAPGRSTGSSSAAGHRWTDAPACTWRGEEADPPPGRLAGGTSVGHTSRHAPPVGWQAMQLLDGTPVYSATDLVGFLACGHRFELERAALAGLVKKPIRSDPTIELIQERGYEHERRYLDDLRAAGRTIVEIPRDGSAANTRDGLREAAALDRGGDARRRGRRLPGHVLRRSRGAATPTSCSGSTTPPGEPPSALGAWHYEVADTKLARHVKAGAVLQICSYVDQLERIQGRRPEHLHVALGGSARETVSLRVDDYMAYYRRVKADFLAAADEVARRPAGLPAGRTYPEPVEHCDVCRWWADCSDRRRADDDLSLVAGISARQRRGLKGGEAGQLPGRIATRRGTGGARARRASRSSTGAAARPWSAFASRRGSRSRARTAARSSGSCSSRSGRRRCRASALSRRPASAHLVPDRGFLVLPEPSPNDLFLDLEGDPFAFDDGIDYLFGDPRSRRTAEDDPDGQPRDRRARRRPPGAGPVPRFVAVLEPRRRRARHPRRREGRLRAARGLPHRPARRGPDAPRLPLRRVREDRPRRASPSATRPARRRSTGCSAAASSSTCSASSGRGSAPASRATRSSASSPSTASPAKSPSRMRGAASSSSRPGSVAAPPRRDSSATRSCARSRATTATTS